MGQQRTHATKAGEATGRAKAAIPAPSAATPLMSLQRTLGNRAFSRLLRSGAIQPKLSEPIVNSPGDRYEREADEVADKVMRIPESAPIISVPTAVRRDGEVAEEEEKNPIQTKGKSSAHFSADLDAGAAVRGAEQGGAPLSKEVRSYFEPRFGHDFSQVRIHADGEGPHAARAVQARAYTYGSDIVFASGEYAPATAEGGRLLAHELAHVLQQVNGAPPLTRRVPDKPQQPNEDVGEGGAPIGINSATGLCIQRAPDVNAAHKSGGEGWPELVQATVEELDKRSSHYWSKPKYGDADDEVLLNILGVALEKDWLKLWALGLQAREGEFGNHLNQFFLKLNHFRQDLGKKFRILLAQNGIEISSTSGHFQNVDYLDPSVLAPSNPAIAEVPWSRRVDNFKMATYDLGYKRRPGSLSETLRLSYEDGTTIDISLWDISDNIDTAWANAISQSYLGSGGRVFPSRLSRNTVPRLWKEKQNVLAKMGESNQDFETFSSISVAAVMSNLPIGPVVGPEAPIEPATPPRSTRSPVREAPPNQSEPGASPPEQAEPQPPKPAPSKTLPKRPIGFQHPTAAAHTPASTDIPPPLSPGTAGFGRDIKPPPPRGPAPEGPPVITQMPPARVMPSSSSGKGVVGSVPRVATPKYNVQPEPIRAAAGDPPQPKDATVSPSPKTTPKATEPAPPTAEPPKPVSQPELPQPSAEAPTRAPKALVAGKGVEIVDAGGTPIGEFDEVAPDRFVEDKSAKGLNTPHPRTGQPVQSPEQWAEKQIFDKTVVRIENLKKAVATRPTKGGSPTVPALTEIKGIRQLEFRIEAGTPEVQAAVAKQIAELTKKYPDWTFSAIFGP